MPGTDGVDLLKKWTKTDKLKAPIVMISGHATIKTAVETTRLGAFDFIEKPFSMDHLTQSVQNVLKFKKNPSEITKNFLTSINESLMGFAMLIETQKAI